MKIHIYNINNNNKVIINLNHHLHNYPSRIKV